LEAWGEWVREFLLLDVPHRQVVFTIPKTLRIFFKFRRRLLGELCRSAVRALTVYLEALAGEELVPGIIVAVQTFGDWVNFHPRGTPVSMSTAGSGPGLRPKPSVSGNTWSGPSWRWTASCSWNVRARSATGMVRTAQRWKGWAEMIRKVYEVDPMICPRCGGTMKVVAFLTDYAVVDRIIRHLELTFVAEKPPPAYAFEQVALMAAEESGGYE
jgi:hypothetical protein